MNKLKTSINYKLMLLGNSGVGKTAYSYRLLNKQFYADHISTTLGCEKYRKVIPLEDGAIASIDLWDTAGQERFVSIPKNIIKRVDGILLVYDITNKQSLIDIMNWMKYLDEFGEQNIPFVMVGNKSDLRQNRKVSFEEAEEIALMKNTKVYEVSCQNNINVMESFNYCVSIVHKFRLKNENTRRNTITLDDTIPDKGEANKCCG